jgi:hypothetical protein
MDLYTLNENFLAKDMIDQFTSAIWTERYSLAGDVQLVVPATPKNITVLSPGIFLSLRGSKEVMQIQTQSIEDNLMTVTGETLVKFLNERFAWFKNPESTDAGERIKDYVDDTKKPGQFISEIVNKTAISPTSFGGAYAPADLNWPLEVLPALTLGAIDTSGTAKRLTMPVGPVYDGISRLATDEGVGISLYLNSADTLTGYTLKFKTYQGKDRTSTQTTYPLIRLVPELDSISDVKELHSIASYKNVAYVYYQGIITEHLAEPTLPSPEGFARRSLVVNPEGDPAGHQVTLPGQWGRPYTVTVVDAGDIAAFRAQIAKDALANNNYIRAIDGEVSRTNEYVFGTDYDLGDIIELEGLTGTIQKARVTEYIRAHDSTGERAYPTLSVLEPSAA